MKVALACIVILRHQETLGVAGVTPTHPTGVLFFKAVSKKAWALTEWVACKTLVDPLSGENE